MNQPSYSNAPEPERLSLDLTNAPSVLFLYGLAGAGKDYVANVIGKESGRFVYNADDDFTDEMQAAIDAKETFTPEMRDRYIAIVAEKIVELQKEHKELVVTQATYKQEHRNYLLSVVDDMDVLCVTAPPSLIEQRLKRRGDAITPEYAARMRANFEPPTVWDKIIFNDADSSRVISQLNALYGQSNDEWMSFSVVR
jgi:gluconate kinase